MQYRYFTCGSRSEKEGLTSVKFSYYDDGELAVGVENPFDSLYKLKEITEEEYNNIQKEINDPNSKIGFAGGLVDDTGWKKYRDWLKRTGEKRVLENEPKIALTVKKIKKQLDLGIIEQADIDTEIELNGMKEFAEIIKERVAQ